jgi:transglutaminase-like putative cysteine protease
MVEGLRRLGYAALFATGYIYSPGLGNMRGAGATHAWCEVFLPDLGWVEFDPTNGLAESPDLIRVATTRTPWPGPAGLGRDHRRPRRGPTSRLRGCALARRATGGGVIE